MLLLRITVGENEERGEKRRAQYKYPTNNSIPNILQYQEQTNNLNKQTTCIAVFMSIDSKINLWGKHETDNRNGTTPT